MNKLLEDLKTYGKNISVLYVEDNEDIRSSTLKILQRFFYNIIEAEDGLDGFNKYKSNINTIDLVITDIGMPQMNVTLAPGSTVTTVAYQRSRPGRSAVFGVTRAVYGKAGCVFLLLSNGRRVSRLLA